jgi:2OG-Fe(II) oxygenase superfamily
MKNISKNSFVLDHKTTDIYYWKNVVENSKNILDYVEKLENDKTSYIKIDKWSPWTASNDTSVIYGALKNFYPYNLHVSTGNEENDSVCFNIINQCAVAFHMCFNLYFQEHGLNSEDYNIDYNWLVLKRWNVGSIMGPHFDGSYGEDNKLAFTAILYFNDNYEGGELYFNNYNVLLKPEAGSMVIFPGSFIHEVKEIKGNNRYMMSISAYKK